MLRTVCCCALLAFLATVCPAEESVTAKETLIRLSVAPASAPTPALRYTLLPDVGELNPGNPAFNYVRCFMSNQEFFFGDAADERRKKLLAMPLKDLPAQELLHYGGDALTQADWAARLDVADWEMLLPLKRDGVAVKVADLNDIRSLANPLKLRFRAEVALNRFDDGVRSAKTIFALSRHLSEHPTPIGAVVGINMAFAAIEPLEEMLERPGCPNLYWALTNLPSPLVPMGRAMSGECATTAPLFRDLDSTKPISTAQLEAFIALWDRAFTDAELAKPAESRVRNWLRPRIKDETALRAARRRLVETGLSDERLATFPPEQVILLDEKREYDVRIQDIVKTTQLPLWQAEAFAVQSAKNQTEGLFTVALIPGVYAVRVRHGQLEQRIALLRHVEALRLHAAEHNGELPASLADVTVPLSVDPFTGKPFLYERTGNTAHLRGGQPLSVEDDPRYHVHFEVTVVKSRSQ